MVLLFLACADDPVDLRPGKPGRDTAAGDDTGGDTAPEETGSAPLDCDPGADDVYAVEGEAINTIVRCATGAAVDHFEVSELPAGATWDRETATIAWTPGLDAAGHYEPKIVAVRGEETDDGEVDLWIADAWDNPGNVPVDPLTYEEEYGLPVLHLTRPPDTNSDNDVTTTMVYRGEVYTIGLQYRGASSLYYPKNSYKLSFAPDQEFKDDKIDYPKRRSVVLTTPFDDPSYIRQKLTFDTWDALRPTRRQVATAFVIVYINGEYCGLYMLGDHIDKEWWEDQGYTEEGNLYKSVDHSASWYNADATGWEKKDGEPIDDFSDLNELLSWVVYSSDEDFVAGIDDRVPMDDIADWWVMCVGAWIDDSCGKNAYMYHDRLTDDKFRHVPWDFNASWGREWETSKTDPLYDYDFTDANNLFERSLGNADLAKVLIGDLHDAMAGPMSVTEQNARIDAYMADIEPSMNRDWDKWRGDFKDYFGWGGSPKTAPDEVVYLRQWISDRNDFLAGRYP